jgi:L,D-peptidoglycan transpeptidase YkuD (ErfK/YbiS/YcfS/YnhG family)
VKRRTARVIRVFRSPLDKTRGRLAAPGLDLPCSLGRSGPRAAKREGDGATPFGRFTVLGGFYRPDRLLRPWTAVSLRRSRPDLGWCDDPRDRNYNRPIPLPATAGHEKLWREDGLYDVVLDLSYNRGPRRRGRGSAIFLHLARPDGRPTEGCVAVNRQRMARLLARLGPATTLVIGPSARPIRRDLPAK